MATTLQSFSVLSSGAFNAASSGSAVFPFGFNARKVEIFSLGTIALWAKLGTTGFATSGDLCITSCASGLPNFISIDLGFGFADGVAIFATSTAAGAAQFVINAWRPTQNP